MHPTLLTQEFRRALKETMASNRLSSSRVEAVKAAAAKCFDVGY